MTDDPKTQKPTDDDETPPIPDPDPIEQPAEKIEEKGEPFDGNFA